MNNYDLTISSIHGAPVVEWDGYTSQALAVTTTPEYHVLRKNTTYRVTASGDDVHVTLLSPEQVNAGEVITTSNSLFLLDGETQYITTTSDVGRRSDPDVPTGYYILGIRANDGSGTAYVTIMRGRRTRYEGK